MFYRHNTLLVATTCVAATLLLAGCKVGLPFTSDTTTSNSVTAQSQPNAPTPAAGTAMAVLSKLPVRGRAPKTGYNRDKFGAAWSDDVADPSGHNGCDQRSDILRRDLNPVTIKAGTHGCVPATGILHDPYTGKVIQFIRGASTSTAVQIDHIAAISNLWQTGAQQLTQLERQNLAGDPLELIAVDGPTNEAKGDGDAATWLPPNKTFRCSYVNRQIAVKAKYHLWVTASEKSAMLKVLNSCPKQPVPTETSVGVVTPALLTTK